MGKIFAIAFKDVKIRYRDLYSFIFLLVMPLVLIFILGLTFNSTWTSPPFVIDVGVVDRDGGEFANILLKDVFEGDALKEILNVKYLNSKEEAIEKVNRGELAAAVFLPEGFSDSIIKGEEAEIEVVGDPEQTIGSGVVKSIVESYTLEVLKRRTIIETTLGMFAPLTSADLLEIQKLFPLWLEEIEAEKDLVFITTETENRSATATSAMGYYAIGMAVMYLMFATNSGAGTIFEERRIRTYDRLKILPVSERFIFLGKLAGIFLVAIVQFLIIFLFTRFVYGVDWGSSYGGLCALAVSSALAFSGFSTFFASVSKSEQQLSSIGPSLAMIFGFLGGGMWPIYTFPSWLNVVSRFTPNRWALDGFLKVMEDNANFTQVLPECGVLLLMGVVFFLIGTLRLGSKGA